MLKYVVTFVQWAYGEVPSPVPLPTPEEWAMKHGQDKACPDKIIAAAIVQSFATDYSNWGIFTYGMSYNRKKGTHQYDYNTPQAAFDLSNHSKIYAQHTEAVVLRNNVTGVELKIRNRTSSSDNTTISIDGVELDKSLVSFIIDGWLEKDRAEKRAKQARLDAERAMKDNEKKWDIVEKLLNMKRNEHGALVAIKDESNERAENELEASERVLVEYIDEYRPFT